MVKSTRNGNTGKLRWCTPDVGSEVRGQSITLRSGSTKLVRYSVKPKSLETDGTETQKREKEFVTPEERELKLIPTQKFKRNQDKIGTGEHKPSPPPTPPFQEKINEARRTIGSSESRTRMSCVEEEAHPSPSKLSTRQNKLPISLPSFRTKGVFSILFYF